MRPRSFWIKDLHERLMLNREHTEMYGELTPEWDRIALEDVNNMAQLDEPITLEEYEKYVLLI